MSSLPAYPLTLILRFVLEAAEEAVLPRYKGSMFRGSFGAALKQIACLRSRRCSACQNPSQCLYGLIFEPAAPDASRYSDRPRPFVIRDLSFGQRSFRPGDSLAVEMVLLGPAATHYVYVLLAMELAASKGLGVRKAKFRLLSVSDHAGRLVYDAANGRLRAEPQPVQNREIAGMAASLPSTLITIHFLTPTRLKESGQLVDAPSFSTLMRAAVRRLEILTELYGTPGATLHLPDYGAAEDVRVLGSTLRWQRLERYSNRQGRRVSLGGLVGSLTYGGDLRPWREVLAWCEILHVGKGTTFGLGRLQLDHGSMETDRTTGNDKASLPGGGG